MPKRGIRPRSRQSKTMRRMAVALALMLSGCVSAETRSQAAYPPGYLGIETRRLDDEMVNFRVAMRHAEKGRQLEDYAACAAAQYALIRGYMFARHVRTTLEQRGAIGRADAVYLISATLPRGVATIDAETTVRDCGARGIPTV